MGVSHIGIGNSGQCDHGGLVSDVNHFQPLGFRKTIGDFASGRRTTGVTHNFSVVQIAFTPGANNSRCCRVRSQIHDDKAAGCNIGAQQVGEAAVRVDCDIVCCLQTTVGQCAHAGHYTAVDLGQINNLQTTGCFVGHIRMLSECFDVAPGGSPFVQMHMAFGCFMVCGCR